MPLDNPSLLSELPQLQVHVAEAAAGDAVTLPKARGSAGTRVWFDVGAHLGEKTWQHVVAHSDLLVFAFEPNLTVAAQRFASHPRYVVLPLAVSEADAFAAFFLNDFAAASSLLAIDPTAREAWRGGEALRETHRAVVPTTRLDTFMQRMNIQDVEFLKIDAQGGDMAVVRSLGDRIANVQRIELEVATTEHQLYRGASTREEFVGFMQQRGFELVSAEAQSFDQELNLTFVRRGAGRAIDA